MAKKSNKLEDKQLKQINTINEGIMSRFMKKILTKRFARILKVGYNDPTVRAAYDAFYKSVDELESELKGSSRDQRHMKSKKFKKAISKPGKDRKAAVRDMMKRWGYIN